MNEACLWSNHWLRQNRADRQRSQRPHSACRQSPFRQNTQGAYGMTTGATRGRPNVCTRPSASPKANVYLAPGGAFTHAAWGFVSKIRPRSKWSELINWLNTYTREHSLLNKRHNRLNRLICIIKLFINNTICSVHYRATTLIHNCHSFLIF